MEFWEVLEENLRTFIGVLLAAWILYKILDRLIRIPKIGELSDRFILVTGCDSGFGNEIARRLDKMGCHVFAACLTESGERQLRKSSSDRMHAVRMDVTKHASIRKAYGEVQEALPVGKGE